MKLDEKVEEAVKAVVPKGKRFTVVWEPLQFHTGRILRVLTPAWKTLPRYRRIMKVQEALNDMLSAKELDRIFRVSVMTAQEFKKLQQVSPGHRSRSRKVSALRR